MADPAEQGTKRPGLPPGTLIHVGERRADRTKIAIIDYDEARLEEREAASVEECFPFKGAPTVTWINVDGLHDVAVVESLGTHFDFHPLVLEDILNTGQRPKMQDFGQYIFVVLKMPYFDEQENEVEAEQVSLVLGPDFVMSFQEREGDVFAPVRERIRGGLGRLRTMGAGYLAYALIDAVVDHYFVILEALGDRIEQLEDELVADPTPRTLQAIHDLKREMILLRRSVWPLREVLSGLERVESPLIPDAVRVFLRDVYDHTIQVIDTIESFRDMVAGMLDTYLSSISNKMNEVMKVLTIIATLFIPLTFVAGVYGMNFQYMPELAWRWGYAAVWGVMLVTILGMLLYFRRKGWLSTRP